ncbi:hypothetical protein PMAYCL1PPCAC_24588, partial [Pristionchus mayeri]
EATAGTKRDGKTEGGKTPEENEYISAEKQPQGPQVDQIVMIFPGSDPTPNNWQQADTKISEKSAKDKVSNNSDVKTEASARPKEPKSQAGEERREEDKKKEEPAKPPPPPQQIIVKIEQPKTQPTSSDPPKSDPPPTPKKKKCCP